jgi:hypothetical protein
MTLSWLYALIVNRHFRIDWRAHTVILFLAVSISALFYTIVLSGFQRDVTRQYEEATIICDILRQSTLNHPGRCGIKNSEEAKNLSRSALIDLLTIADVIDRDEATSLRESTDGDAGISAKEFIIAELSRDDRYLKENIQVAGGLNWAIHLAQSIGQQSAAEGIGPEDVLELHRKWVSVSLANVHVSEFDRAVDAYSEAILDGKTPFDPSIISGFVFFPSEIVDDTDVISPLYAALGVTKDMDSWDENKQERFQDVDTLIKFIVAQSHGDLGVKKAKRWLTILRGPEQLLIIILTTYLLMVLLLRAYFQHYDQKSLPDLRSAISTYAKETLGEMNEDNDENRFEEYRATLRTKLKGLIEKLDPQKSLVGYIAVVINNKLLPHDYEIEIATLRGVAQSEIDQLYLSRWAIRWSTRIIPAIGFIGTVRGILYALPGTDNIVWAASRAERASAIGIVATDLGLAFATTFMALVVGVLLSWLNDLEMTEEEKYVVRLSELGSTAVDPRLGVH